ncbi:MAG TPA: hypothetical protein VF727_00825 [Allosphingosinicella sp.]|jgi:hypothetical protein
MYLAEADPQLDLRTEERPARAPALPSDRWTDFPHSQLSHHGAACCETARQWVVAMDFAQLNGGDLASGPRWLRERYKWGPSPWPMHWCELVKRKVIDCGAHSALAHEVFSARGLAAFPAQLVQRYSEDATHHWRGKWSEEDVSCHWLDGEHIYHEATAILLGEDEVKIWDSSAGSWVNPRQAGGYGSLAAVRIFADGHYGGGDGLRWGERRLKPNIWNQI